MQVREVASPSPAPGEILIRVAYAACNWGDIQKRQGIYPDAVTYPIILGGEVSGRVEAVGPGVRGFVRGDRVAALCGPTIKGGYAERVSVPVAYAAKLPPRIRLDKGATLLIAALTAYHLLFTATRLRRGETLLVHAVSGSVGLMVTQLAKSIGGRVIGTVGTAVKAKQALALGADKVIDRSKEDFVAAAMAFTGGRGVDLVIDSLGADILPRSFEALRPYGRVINIGEAAGEPEFPVRKTLYRRSTSLAGFEVLHAVPGSPLWRRGLRHVLKEVEAGRLTMPIAGRFPLDSVAEMHAAMEGRGVAGKLLLTVAGG